MADQQVMDGRFFSGTRVEAYVADGSERFKKSGGGEKKVSFDNDDEEEEGGERNEEGKRLDQFGSWLEGGGSGGGGE